MSRLKFEINGQPADAPKDWQDVEVLATFENENTQANITTEQFTFVLEEAAKIRQHLAGGLAGGVGIFEGIPFKILTYNATNNYTAFDGFIDLSDEFENDLQNSVVKARIKKSNGLNSLEEQLQSLSYGYLYDKGLISGFTDVEYIVEKKFNIVEILTNSVIIYLMTKELAESIRTTVKSINDAIAIFTGGITGPIAAAIWTIAEAIIQIAYTAVLLVAVIELGNRVISAFISPIRKHKTNSFYNLLSQVATYLGYSFESGITELSSWSYLASNPQLDTSNNFGFLQTVKSIEVGIPNVQDYGYNCLELFELCSKMFNAKYALVGNKLVFRNVDDPFWIQNSSYRMPSILLPPTKYNTEDFAANRLIAFDTDLQDEWTIENFTGTNYEIITDAISTVNQKAKYIKGLDEIRLPICLGNRKNEPSALESVLLTLAKVVDKISTALGGNANLQSQIRTRVGVLRVSQNNHSKPKVLKLSGGRLPLNYRDIVRAKYLYENFYQGKSFVLNNNFGQKQLYTGVKIPFGLSEFLQLIENSYFYDNQDREAKATRIAWRIGADYAIFDFWVREPYTKNLTETYIEP